MKTHNYWSYQQYKPLFYECGDIYICRVNPGMDFIEFDWFDIGSKSYQIYIRERGADEFLYVGNAQRCTYRVEGLNIDTDYEFYVEADGKKSRVRLARCGEAFGTVVNYLHPDDEVYEFSGRYFGSPSLVRHPDGFLLASMDLFAKSYPMNLTLIYRSDDNGKTWYHLSELMPCQWGDLFIYNNELYMVAVSTGQGDLLIGKSTDGGVTFTQPTVLMRGSGGKGKRRQPGVHKTPMPMVEHKGRIWITLEWGAWDYNYHATMVMSAEVGADLLDPNSWSFSEPLKYDPTWEGVPEGESSGNIEGCLVEKSGELYSIMRYDMTKMNPCYGLVVAYKIDTDNPENPMQFDHCIEFPANYSKFEMKYDADTAKYYSIATRIPCEENAHARTLLSLMVSEDLEHWDVMMDIMDKTDCDKNKVGFQYVDFMIEDGIIRYLCRTGMNNANSHHNSNYIIYGEINLKEII